MRQASLAASYFGLVNHQIEDGKPRCDIMSWFEKQNGQPDDWNNMGFPTEEEAWEYAKESGIKVEKMEVVNDQTILWTKDEL